MRLADPLYESMPLVYAAIGAGAFFISYLDPEDPRTSIALCIGLVCEIAYSGETIELPTRLRR
jgi:hypothetical protein